MSNPPLLPAALIPGDDPLGLAAWANSCCVGRHTAIAVAASILAGIAGPMGRLPAKAPVRFPGINLAGRQADSFLKMAMDGLVRSLLSIERALVAKSKEFTNAEIEAAMFATNRQRTASDLKQLGEPGPLDQELADSSALARLQGDLQISEQSVRYERLVRPRFILAGHTPPSLVQVLSDFHYGHALLAGPFESLPRPKPKRHLRVDEFLKCFDGTEATPTAASKGNGSRIAPQSVCMKGVVLFPTDQWNWLANTRRDFFSRAIPVVALPPGVDLDPADELRAVVFERNFQRVANLALASRRTHASVGAGFHSEAAMKEFLARQRTFIGELEKIPESVRVTSASGLPATLTWALLLLAGKADMDCYILETVFASASQIVEDARRLFVGFDQQALGERCLKNARKLHARVIQGGPLPRWQLLRGLDQQSLKIHGPTIRAMIQLGILMQDDKDLLHPGTVPLHQMTAQHLIDLDGSP